MATKTIHAVCHLPEEPVWDEDGDEIVDPGSLPATRAVAELVRGMGYECTEFEVDLEHCSWTFDAKADDSSYYVLVCHVDTELHVTMSNFSGCLSFGAGPGGTFSEFVETLCEKMVADDRFEQVAVEARA